MVIAKFRSQLSISWDQALALLRHAENVLDRLKRKVANWLRQVRQDFSNDCRALRADSRRVRIVANETLVRWGSRVVEASRHATMRPRNAQNAVSGSESGMVFKPRGILRSQGTSENDVRNFLANSLDAVVLTDRHRRLVAANAKSLELFGISEFNMRNFTLDAFVASVEPPDLDWSHARSKGREVRLRCKIRRLDGGSLLADCQFVAGILPHRYLCKFLNVTQYKITPPAGSKRNQCAVSQTAVRTLSNLVPNAKSAR